MASIDEQWLNYLNNNYTLEDGPTKPEVSNIDTCYKPTCQNLSISTKTKVLYLNQEIDIETIFWKIPIVKYWEQREGIIKKQMKIISKSNEDVLELQNKLKEQYYYTENIIKQINNTESRRVKFKDERKITIGISKKDIMSARGKTKNAFYNCFAIIIRYLYEGSFREIHVKVFNTGKMEIPGVLNDEILAITKSKILDLLSPFLETPIDFIEKDIDVNVLINSNFNCGFYINRDTLYTVLKNEYNIETSYEPCSYPGVKSKYYYNHELPMEQQNGQIVESDRSMKMCELLKNKKYTEISFMIFRTGSCLIIGNCREDVLMCIYSFIRNILESEYSRIVMDGDEVPPLKAKIKKVKRKKIISNHKT